MYSFHVALAHIMYPGINRASQLLKDAVMLWRWQLPNGTAYRYKTPREWWSPPGSWNWMLLCLSLPSCAIVCCIKLVLFQHLTNTVCRPTLHTHKHAHTGCHCVFSLIFSLRYLAVPLVSICNKTHPAGDKGSEFQMCTVMILLPLSCLKVPTGAGGAGW